jgi:hypothetical protein
VKIAPWIILAIVGIVLVREFFPRRVEVIMPPRITTIHDTIRSLDTLWITKLKTKTDTLYQERITLSLPETVFVTPRVWGLTALSVAPKVGDSTLAQGFSLEPGDSGQTVRMNWRVQWWTPGPLRALVVSPDGVRVGWGPPPKPGCGLFCALKKYALGAGAGWAVCKL